MKRLLVVISCFMCLHMVSQEVELQGAVEAAGVFSSDDILPFWLHTNSSTKIGPKTTFSGMATLTAQMAFENETLIKAGATLLGRNGFENDVERRDLYVQFENKWLLATLGSKMKEELLDGLSASNKNFIYSGNARPLPGLAVEANAPFRISNTFSFDWGIGHYSLNDDRYVDDVRVHYKRLGLISNLNENSKLTLRLQHFAQWAGTSPEGGELQNDFKAFVNVFFARKGEKGGDFGEALNALGNHIGSYFIEYEWKTDVGTFSAYHDHPFEDGSGTRLANLPDGIWGLSFQINKESLISTIVYEYIDSSDQSGTDSNSGFDGYFGNSIYRSGWTYDGNVIGLPFILNDTSIVLNELNSPFISNRAQVHHLAIAGNFKQLDWKLKTTYFKNLGTYRAPFNPEVINWLNYFSLSYTTPKYGRITLLGGLDTSEIIGTNLGGGMQYRLQF